MPCTLHRPIDLLYIVYAPLFVTRQFAKVFNQPLNFDTSRVTTMEEMFEVHSARALHSDSSRAFSCMLHARPSRRPTPKFPASYALLIRISAGRQ